MFIKFVERCEFRANQFSGSDTSLNSINKFLSVVAIFLDRGGCNSAKQIPTLCRSAIVTFVKIGALREVLFSCPYLSDLDKIR